MSATKTPQTSEEQPSKPPSKPPSKQGLSMWIWALLVSVALNGLFIGLLLSSGLNKSPDNNSTRTPYADGTHPKMQHGRPLRLQDNDPRSLMRSLPRERREQLMEDALKNLNLDKDNHPRRMFKQMREAKYQARTLIQADPLDPAAIEAALSRVRKINQEISINGDALYVNILTNLTVEERLAAQKNRDIRKDKRSGRKRMRKQSQ